MNEMPPHYYESDTVKLIQIFDIKDIEHIEIINIYLANSKVSVRLSNGSSIECYMSNDTITRLRNNKSEMFKVSR